MVESHNQQVKLFVEAKRYKSALVISMLHAPGWNSLMYLLGGIANTVFRVQHIPHLPW